MCEQALELMTRRTGYADDIAVLVAEVTEAPPPLHLELTADAAAVPRVLDALATWLESMHVRDLDHMVVQHAVDELVTNVVEHAYPDGGPVGRITIDAALLGTGEVEIRFADDGGWVPPRTGTGRGRGLSLVRGMVDRLVVQGAAGGTVAQVRHRLSRPARMLTGASVQDPASSASRDARWRPTPTGSMSPARSTRSVSTTCAVPSTTSRTAAGWCSTCEGVTRLPSSAVQALHVASRDAADRGQDLVLYAPAGTTAQHVLELVRLPYVLAEPERLA